MPGKYTMELWLCQHLLRPESAVIAGEILIFTGEGEIPPAVVTELRRGQNAAVKPEYTLYLKLLDCTTDEQAAQLTFAAELRQYKIGGKFSRWLLEFCPLAEQPEIMRNSPLPWDLIAPPENA